MTFSQMHFVCKFHCMGQSLLPVVVVRFPPSTEPMMNIHYCTRLSHARQPVPCIPSETRVTWSLQSGILQFFGHCALTSKLIPPSVVLHLNMKSASISRHQLNQEDRSALLSSLNQGFGKRLVTLAIPVILCMLCAVDGNLFVLAN